MIALDSDSPEAYNERANFYSAIKEYDKAIADCNTAISLDNTFFLAYFNRAASYIQL